ncbi:hypothetical protein [Vibrio agarivorans]|uniref:ParB/Sulfiredoxin domain-containing protein n=1 Tax=Vibrio agarivorans TaxID=153622 RepID=A0ABT7Y7E0_9VIBR|nr:hypothetical protein [Vibrio agarivorans]MDN2483917.1 hypothetical protein [Vibrio agarivorans]
MGNSDFDSLDMISKLSLAEKVLDAQAFGQYKELAGSSRLTGTQKALFRRLSIEVKRTLEAEQKATLESPVEPSQSIQVDSGNTVDEQGSPAVSTGRGNSVQSETDKPEIVVATDATIGDVTDSETVVSAASFSTQYTFTNTGRTVKAEFVVIQPEHFHKVRIHPLNPRKQEGLTEASLSDILPSIKFKGISRPGYSFFVEGKDLLADSSRRFKCADIAKKPLPLIRILEPCTDEEVQSLIDEVDSQRQLSRYEEGLKYKDVFLALGKSYKDTYAHFNVLPEKESSVRRSIIAACMDERLYELFPDRYCISASAYEKLNQQTDKAMTKFSDSEDPIKSWLDAANSLSEKPTYKSPFSSVDDYTTSADSEFVTKAIQKALGAYRQEVLKYLDQPLKKTDDEKAAEGTWVETVVGDKQNKCSIIRYNKVKREYNLKMRKASPKEVAALDYFLERLGDKEFLQQFDRLKEK